MVEGGAPDGSDNGGGCDNGDNGGGHGGGGAVPRGGLTYLLKIMIYKHFHITQIVIPGTGNLVNQKIRIF